MPIISQQTPVHSIVLAEETEAQRKLRSFAMLEDGWNYGDGTAFGAQPINGAGQIANLFVQSGIGENDAFPGLAGQIMITGYVKDFYLEYTIYNGGEVSFRAKRGDIEVADTGRASQKDALESFVAVVGGIWGTSGSSTQNSTTIGVAIGSTGLLLAVSKTEAPRSLVANVWTTPDILDANSSEGITRDASGAIQ